MTFLEAIQDRVLLFDGGMGTALYGKGVFPNKSYEEINLVQPELVEEVHRAFLLAGADAVETNTFAANRTRLEPRGLEDRVREINRLGAQIARRVAREFHAREVFVAGSVGPLGVRLEPWGPTSVDEAAELFREQIEGLVEGGVDLLVFETFGDLIEIQTAVEVARSVQSIPVLAMMTVDEQGRTPEGVAADWMARKLGDAGADVVGANCSVGPAPMLSVIETMAEIVDTPLAAMPNAGMPRAVDGRTLYLSSPDYIGSYARRFMRAGARVIGGCCGFTAEHIEAMRTTIDDTTGFPRRPHVAVAPPPSRPETPPVPTESKSSLARKISSGRFVRVAEVIAPLGWKTEDLDASIEGLAGHDVDAVFIRDARFTAARLSALAMARLVEESQVGRAEKIEPLLLQRVRERDLAELQSQLLGVHALGLRNLCLVTAPQNKPGEARWEVRAREIDAIGLLNVATRLNHGLDVGSNAIGSPTAFYAGAYATIAAPDFDTEVARFEWKVDAGAEFFITSPVFDVTDLVSFLERISSVRVPVIATIRALSSARDAEFLGEEVPGIHVPTPIIDRLEVAEHESRAPQVGIEIAQELIEAVTPHVEGILLSGPRATSEPLLRAAFDSAPQRAEQRSFPGHAGIKSSDSAR